MFAKNMTLLGRSPAIALPEKLEKFVSAQQLSQWDAEVAKG